MPDDNALQNNLLLQHRAARSHTILREPLRWIAFRLEKPIHLHRTKQFADATSLKSGNHPPDNHCTRVASMLLVVIPLENRFVNAHRKPLMPICLVHICAQISEITRFNHPNGLWGYRSPAILSLCEGGGNSSDVTSGQCGPVLKHSIG
jgi:hypothetical protein